MALIAQDPDAAVDQRQAFVGLPERGTRNTDRDVHLTGHLVETTVAGDSGRLVGKQPLLVDTATLVCDERAIGQ